MIERRFNATQAMIPSLNKVPVGVRHIISKATQRAKDDRYQTVAELMDAVRLYLTSIDSKKNIKASFENVRLAVTELAAQGRYKPELLAELFVYASALFDEGWSAGLNAFDTIEPRILGLGAQQVPEQLAETLKRYIKVIEDHVGSYPFEYAEGVARRMNQVFNNSEYPELRALSLEATLIGAVSLNRFAAMDTFAANLKKVKDDEALAVAEMLKRQMGFYIVVAPQIDDGELSMMVDEVRKEAIKKASKKVK
jgi:hypothetical protein